MEGNYPMYFDGRIIGHAEVKQAGLYYRFHCRCHPASDVICRVYVRCGASQLDLGVLTPGEDGFCLDKRIPVKRFSEGEPEFSVISHGNRVGETFIPLCPEEPFAYLEKLKQAYLVTRGGQIGVLIRD